MKLRHLGYFVAVGEEQHYGRASRQDLEEEVGLKLFDRLSRGVKLSAAGKLFLEDAMRILQAVNEATARAARTARRQSGTLRIGFSRACVLARRRSGFHPVISRAATRRGTAPSTGGEFGTA
jgi:DNA-binding transcriptional LysR family regulator